MADGTVKILTDLSTEGFKSGMQKLGSIAQAGIKTVKASFAAIGTAVAGAATAIGALAKTAFDGYGDYEQLTGGVETLFKESADIVMGYAENAYKTAGLSANAYMETVTSFSASLLQSLDGDTKAAAEKADMAITDMADNANKMGTSMESIQNAYQGFAKQNYTMLDNLKLGYGGTKTEMERLVEDAERLNSSFKASRDENGKLTLSYGDIVDAIHIVQDNMGITGTTAKEAASTIQGSIGSMKAAWSNFLTGMADPSQDFEKLFDNLLGTIETAMGNIVPTIMNILPRLTDGITRLAESLMPYIPETISKLLPPLIEGATNLVGEFTKMLPDILMMIADQAPAMIDIAAGFIESFCGGLKMTPGVGDAAEAIITALVTGIAKSSGDILVTAVVLIGKLAEGLANGAPQMIESISNALTDVLEAVVDWLPDILTAGESIIMSLIDGITEALPIIVSQAADIISTLASGIAKALPKLAPAAVKAIIGFAQALIDNLPLILDAALQLIQGLADGLLAAIPVLIEALPALIQGIIDFLIEGIPMLIQAAIQLIDGIVAALPTIIQALIDALPQIIESLVSGLIGCIGQLVAGAIQLVVALVTHLPEIIVGLIEAIPQIIEAIIDGFMNGLGSFTEAGSTIIDAMWDGIKAVWDTIVEWFTVCIPELIDNIGKWFSELPDKVTRWFSQLFENVKAWGSTMWAKAKEIGKQFIDGLVNFIKTLPQNVWNWLQNVIGKVTSFASTFGQKALEAGKTFLNNIVNIVKQIPGKMLEIGKNIVSSIWNGISSAASWLWDKISGWCSSIFDGIKGFFGIHSPSRLMADQVGHFLPLGIAEGFDKAMPEAQRDIESGLDDLVEDMTPPVIPIDILAKVRDEGVLSDIQSAVDASAASVTINARARAENDPGKAPAPEAIDYDKLAEAVRSAPIHTEVKIGEKAIVDIVSPGVNRNMGARSVLEKRYA